MKLGRAAKYGGGVLLILLIVLLLIIQYPNFFIKKPLQFDGERAYQDVLTQLSFGPRYPGSQGHQEMVVWLQDRLQAAGWLVELQTLEYLNCPIVNVIAHKGTSSKEWVLLGAHYDTRQFADQEFNEIDQMKPVHGANDGASGVAILLEFARILPKNTDKNISLVFFDCEDNGGIEEKDWAIGSRAYVNSLSEYPDKVVIVDMVGDADLQIYREKSSDDELMDEIWRIAEELEVEAFVNEPKYHMLDDHTAFIQAGIPAVDIIDFDYPFWHTLEDTEDKISPESLQAIGDILLTWLVAE